MTDFELVLDTMRELHYRKNSIYRDSFKDTRDKYPETIAVVLNFKLSRIESLLDQETSDDITEDGVLEGINDSLIDIANYCVMELCHRDKRLQDPEQRKKLEQAYIDHIHFESELHPKEPRKAEFRRWMPFGLGKDAFDTLNQRIAAIVTKGRTDDDAETRTATTEEDTDEP